MCKLYSFKGLFLCVLLCGAICGAGAGPGVGLLRSGDPGRGPGSFRACLRAGDDLRQGLRRSGQTVTAASILPAWELGPGAILASWAGWRSSRRPGPVLLSPVLLSGVGRSGRGVSSCPAGRDRISGGDPGRRGPLRATICGGSAPGPGARSLGGLAWAGGDGRRGRQGRRRSGDGCRGAAPGLGFSGAAHFTPRLIFPGPTYTPL